MKTNTNHQQPTPGGTSAGHASEMIPVTKKTTASGRSRPVRQKKDIASTNPWGLSEVRVDAVAGTGTKPGKNISRKPIRQGNTFRSKRQSGGPALRSVRTSKRS